jgi:cyclic-di-GMP-binding protein
MASFDIVSKIDPQSLDNAVNVARKEIVTRFDFRESKSTIELDKKTSTIHLVSENDMRIEAIEDVLRSRLIKQKIDPNCMDFGKERYASGNMLKKDIKLKEGVDKETAKKIIKDIKDSKLKVQAQVMEEQVRVTGKKLDDLQEIIALIRSKTYDVPLQFDNFK